MIGCRVVTQSKLRAKTGEQTMRVSGRLAGMGRSRGLWTIGDDHHLEAATS